MVKYPFKLTPVIKDYLWGGRRLLEQYGKVAAGDVAAESWEVSCHPDGPSRIANGGLAGRTLAEVLAGNPDWVGRGHRPGDPFPLLIKLIDAERDLSIQVHPGDDYAWRVENQPGKNEMWYVVDAAADACLYLGFATPISREEIRQRIEANTLLEVLRRVPVAAGDSYCIPAGLVHAIGGGALIAEVQQSSNVTYRVYDYDRRDAAGNPRELHIEKALEVIDPSLEAQRRESAVLADWPYFRAELLPGGELYPLDCGGDGFHCLLALGGEARLSWDGASLDLAEGESVYVPAGLGRYGVLPKGKVLFCSL